MKISVVIVAKNEEKKIGDCLESVKFADEVVVIDDKSTDATVELAKTAGAKIFERKFDGFATQKNFGIEKTSNEWVFILDADERVTEELAKEIQSLHQTEDIKAYSMNFRNYLGSKWLRHGGLYPDPHVRLFDKKHAHYGKREVHEELIVNGSIGHLHGDITHLTYDSSRDYMRKVRKYAHLEAAYTSPPRYRSSIKTFFSRYFVQKGFLDGWAGVVSAVLLAYYQILLKEYQDQS